MRIGVVAYEMEGRPTGVGRYLEGLLKGVAGLGHTADEWLLFFKGKPFEHPLWESLAGGPTVQPVFDNRPHWRPILWEQLRLPKVLRQANLDLLFSPGYSLPKGVDVPMVVTLHDLSFEHLGDEFSFKERWRRRFLARRAAQQATRVLADTQTIASDLATTYGLPPEKIGIVPLGIAQRFRSRRGITPADDAARLGVVGVRPPYLLALGTIMPRRRTDLVIRAFREIAEQYPKLTLVLGGSNRLRHPRDLDRWIRDSGVAERIVRLDWVPEESLAALYRRSELSIYLSTYEGYGLPPLEALALGTPVLVSPRLALDDLWPGYPLLCPRLDAETVASSLRQALADPEALRQVGHEGRQRLSGLGWEQSSALFLGELRKAMS